MHITIEIGPDTNPVQLHAVAALIHSLGGRVPATLGEPFITNFDRHPAVIDVDETHVHATAPAPVIVPPPPPAVAGDLQTIDPAVLANLRATAAVVPPPPPPPAVAAPTGERDTKGIPWDARIHSKSREKIGDESDWRWRKRRGVDDATMAIVTAELLGASASPNAPPPPPPAPMASVAPVATAVASPPPPPPAPTADSAAQFTTFAQLVNSLGARRGGKGYAYDELEQLAKMFGLNKFSELLQHPDRLNDFAALLEA